MKRFIALTVGFSAVIGLTQSAFAGPERIETKQVAPPPEPLCDWTGFYIGGHIGFGEGNSAWVDIDEGDNTLLPNGHQRLEGVFGGLQLGYNYQSGNFVIGLEGDFSFSDVGGTSDRVDDSNTDFDRNKLTTDNDWNATIALRLGYAFADNHLLAYVKLGEAFMHFNYDWEHREAVTTPAPSVDTWRPDEVRQTFMLGAGLEYALNCKWSVKVEANYYFLGKDNVFATFVEENESDEPHETYNIEDHMVDVRLGVNYKFWSLGHHDTQPSVPMSSGRMERLEPKEAKLVAPMPEQCNWTGFYVGVHGGVGAGSSEWRDVDFGDDAILQSGHQWHTGAFGGIQLGYNYQMGSFVLGAEGEFSYSGVGGKTSGEADEDDFDAIQTNNDYTGTVSGRLGYALMDNRFLPYVRGGVSFGHWDYSWDHRDIGEGHTDVFDVDDTRTSAIVGVGAEYAINCHWSVRAETRYTFLDRADVSGPRLDGDVLEHESLEVELRQISAQVGLNYHF